MKDAPKEIWLRNRVEPLHDCGDGTVYFDEVETCTKYIRADEEIRNCPRCLRKFSVGPGAERNKNAKFCSDNCRKRYNEREKAA